MATTSLAGYVMYQPVTHGTVPTAEQMQGALRGSFEQNQLQFDLGSVALPLGVPVPKFNTLDIASKTPSRLLMLYGSNEIRNEIYIQTQKAVSLGWRFKRVQFEVDSGTPYPGLATREIIDKGLRFLNIQRTISAVQEDILNEFRQLARKQAEAEVGAQGLTGYEKTEVIEASYIHDFGRPLRSLATRPDLWPALLDTDKGLDDIDVLVVPFVVNQSDVRVRQIALVKHTIRYIETRTSQTMDGAEIRLPPGFGVSIPDPGNLRRVSRRPVTEVLVSRAGASAVGPEQTPPQ
jgi:hypothetical protein